MGQDHPPRDRRRAGSVVWLALGLAVLAGLGLLAWKVQSSGAGVVSVSDGGATAPDFRLDSLQGEQVRLADFKGRVVVLELWATWCGPCKLQAEILHELYEEISTTEVEFLAISLGETRETVERFVDRQPFTYPVLLDPEETLGTSLEVYALPTVVVIDQGGHIRFHQPGLADAGTLRRVLSGLGVGLST